MDTLYHRLFDYKHGKDCTKAERKTFVHNVRRDYDTESTEEPTLGATWCHVLGRHYLSVTVSSPIIPYKYKMRDLDLTSILGPDFDEEFLLSSSRNGLSLYSGVEKAYDKGQILLVPVKGPDGDMRVRLIVVAKELLGVDTGIFWWRDIDGRTLSFRNDHRPSSTALWFRFALRYLRATSEEKDRVRKTLEEMETETTFWDSPFMTPDGKTIFTNLCEHYKSELREIEGLIGEVVTEDEGGTLTDEEVEAMTKALLRIMEDEDKDEGENEYDYDYDHGVDDEAWLSDDDDDGDDDSYSEPRYPFCF